MKLTPSDPGSASEEPKTLIPTSQTKSQTTGSAPPGQRTPLKTTAAPESNTLLSSTEALSASSVTTSSSSNELSKATSVSEIFTRAPLETSSSVPSLQPLNHTKESDTPLNSTGQGDHETKGAGNGAENTSPRSLLNYLNPMNFYRMWVVCPEMETILERMDSDPEKYPTFQTSPQTRSDSALDFVAARNYFSFMKAEVCSECTCVPKSGRVSRSFDRMKPCYEDDVAERCKEWLGCTCTAEMREDIDRLEEYTFNARLFAYLGVPDWVQKLYPDHSFYANGRWLTWEVARGITGGRTEKYEMTDAKEPYYLEGPDEGYGENGPFAGKGDFGGPGARFGDLSLWPSFGYNSVVKRESPELEDVTEG
ncbi:hypothetical protein TWF481_009113 [Arthrobotrys musiformis]|uniref:Uncharacterized protein n=1 Tax=Arthrobotrys musiformis TaxID=47236 RepID=A0AAV9W4P4_9PEZI